MVWGQLELGDDPSFKPGNSAPVAGSLIPLSFKSGTVFARYVNGSSTELVNLSADGLGETVLTLPGLVFSGTQLQ